MVIMEMVVLYLYYKYVGRLEIIYIDKVCILYNVNNKIKDKSKEKYECVIVKIKVIDFEEMWKSWVKKLDRVMMILNVCVNIIFICICMIIIMI